MPFLVLCLCIIFAAVEPAAITTTPTALVAPPLPTSAPLPTATVYDVDIAHPVTWDGVLYNNTYPSEFEGAITTETVTSLGATVTYAYVGPSPSNYSFPADVPVSVSILLKGQDTVCGRATWFNITLFILVNFILHATTLTSLPGEKTLPSAASAIAALCFPFVGVRRGIAAIATRASRKKGDLDCALAAGALCIVVRDEQWRPMDGDVVQGCTIVRNIPKEQKRHQQGREAGRSSELESLAERRRSVQFNIQLSKTIELKTPLTRRDATQMKVHGYYNLVPGYSLQVLPPNYQVAPLDNHNLNPAVPGGTPVTQLTLPTDRILVKVIGAALQVMSSCWELYKAKGHQIDKYGFTAYGLYVIPYAIMSLINILGHYFAPNFTCVYLIKSDVMEEAESRGAQFELPIGRLHADGRTMSEEGFTCRFSTQIDSADAPGDPVTGHFVDQGQGVPVLDDFLAYPTSQELLDQSIRIPPAGPFRPLKIDRFNKYHRWWRFCGECLVIAIWIAIVAALTKFKSGTDGRSWRFSFWYWCAIAIVASYFAEAWAGMMVELINTWKTQSTKEKIGWTIWAVWCTACYMSAFGMVCVMTVQMMLDLGTCVTIPSNARALLDS